MEDAGKASGISESKDRSVQNCSTDVEQEVLFSAIRIPVSMKEQ